MNTRSEGDRGENIAVKYLKKHGYAVLERNYRCHFGEVDIVVTDKKTVVFVEVKARSNTKFGLPREAVDLHKQKTIIRCADSWLLHNKLTGVPVRFDVVEVLDGKPNHLIDAFRPL